jgi:antitoxin MazE
MEDFSMATKIMRWGNSYGLRLTKAVLDQANLKVGDEVAVFVRRGRILIEPTGASRGKLDLERLVEKIPGSCRAGNVDWGLPSGKEVW